MPNAGKSTFLATVSAAKPKIADYPFTTLHPNLGVARLDDAEFVVADIPGLIEGAHEGVGIGDRFLAHIERCGVLLHLVDATSEDVGEAYATVRGELEAYGHGLADKPEIVALSKCDAVAPEALEEKRRALASAAPGNVIMLSAATSAGVREALSRVKRAIDAARAEEAAAAAPVKEWRP